jgi:catechol 2,3-dioxygenase-like lactoylglutathione lyase family enzyme
MTPIARLQVNLFCDDVEACLAFYQRFGLTEAFRAPATGPIQHVEVEVEAAAYASPGSSTPNPHQLKLVQNV